MLKAKDQRNFQEGELSSPQGQKIQSQPISQSQIKQNNLEQSQNFRSNEQSKIIQNPPPFKQLPAQQKDPNIIQKTDSFCLYIFILFQIISIIIAVFSLIKGNPDKLARPYDPDHRVCGVDQGVENYPFIYFVTPDEKFLYRTVCVKDCPQQGQSISKKENIYNLPIASLECAVNSVVTSCKLNPQVSDLSNSVLLYNTIKYNSVCLPTTKYYYLELYTELFPGITQSAYKDVSNSRWNIAISIGISLIINISFLLIMERRGKIIIWVLIVLFILASFSGALLSFSIYHQLQNPPPMPLSDTAQVDQSVLYPQTRSENSFPKVFLFIGIILTAVCIVTISLSAFCGKRVILSVEMLKVAGDFIKANKLIILIPVVTFIISWLYSIFWVMISLYLYSTYPISTQSHQLPFEQVQDNITIDILGAIHLFVFFWNQAFFIGASEKLICGAVYDWNDKQGTDPKLPEINPIAASFRRISNAHIGSVSLGALLIALTSFIRIFFQFIFEVSEGVPILQTFCCFCNQCYSKLLGRISKYNYVIVYLDGTGFWQSGQKVITLIQSPNQEVKEILELGMINRQSNINKGGLGEIFTTIGRLFVSGIASLICYKLESGNQFLIMPYVPAFLCFILCFTISSVIMAIYGMSAEAIFMIYIYHKVKNSSNDDQPQCTKTFERFIEQFIKPK